MIIYSSNKAKELRLRARVKRKAADNLAHARPGRWGLFEFGATSVGGVELKSTINLFG